MVFSAMLAETAVSPLRNWPIPQQWVGPPMTW